MVTLREIANYCGCSIATVSKAINGKTDINPETAESIRKAAKELGYTPNMAARALKTNKTRTIGLLWFLKNESVWTHDHFGRIAKGIQIVAERSGYNVTPVICNPETLGDHYVEYCTTRGYDGLVVMCASNYDPGLSELLNCPIPLVSIDFVYQNHAAIQTDQMDGIAQLVRYTYSKGHRRIAYIHGDSESTVSLMRRTGFYCTCGELGLHVPQEYVLESSYRDEESAAAATEKLMSLPEPPTCILYPDDIPATAGYRQLVTMGYKVPDDVSIIGYDGIPLARHFYPRLTTLEQDVDQMGRKAGELIMKAIETPRTFMPEHVMLRGKLYPGETVKDISGTV